MNQSRLMWGLGASAGVFVTIVGMSVRVATMPYQLRIRVTDAQGPLAGVWVSLDDRDVLLTDANGVAVVKGRRFELDGAVLTVSDPSLNQLHLSKTIRTQVSWSPWVSDSQVNVQLPVIDGSPLGAEVGPGARSELDLPLAGVSDAENSGLQNGGDSAQGENSKMIREEVLGSADEQVQPNSPDVPVVTSQQIEVQETFEQMMCSVSGFSSQFCYESQISQRPPLLTSRVLGPVQISKSISIQQPQTRLVNQEIVADADDKQEQSVNKKTKSSEPMKRNVFRLNVTHEGKALAGARVFMSRLRDNRTRELGSTLSDGVIESKIPREFLGESITVFHNCCAPKTFPVNFVGQTEATGLRIEMQSGSGQGVLVQQEAYGLLRRVEQFELSSAKGKLAVSGSDGFALYNNSKTPEHSVNRVKVRSAKPAEFLVSADDAARANSQPLSYFVSTEQTYLPALAIVEQVGGQSFSGIVKNADLRRWRRDFIARLMQLQSVRSVVSVEAESRIRAAGESLPDVVSRGWSETHLAGEWDLLLSMNYDERLGEIKLSAIDSLGKEFFEKKIQFASMQTSLAPESVARRTFDSFVESVPFEASVLQQRDNEIVLSWTDAKQFGLKADAPLAIYQESEGEIGLNRLSDLAALAVVTSIEQNKNIKARITHWNSKKRKTEVLPDVVRVAKVTPEFYQKEAQRRGVSRNLSRNSSGSNKPL